MAACTGSSLAIASFATQTEKLACSASSANCLTQAWVLIPVRMIVSMLRSRSTAVKSGNANALKPVLWIINSPSMGASTAAGAWPGVPSSHCQRLAAFQCGIRLSGLRPTVVQTWATGRREARQYCRRISASCTTAPAAGSRWGEAR